MILAAIALLLFGLARLRWRKLIALAGLPFALSIWIGVEMLPLIGAWFAALGLVWCWNGGSLARQGALAAGLTALIGLFLILTSVPRALWLAPACDAFSRCRSAVALIAMASLAALIGRWARRPVARGRRGVVRRNRIRRFRTVTRLPRRRYGAVDPEVKLRLLTMFERRRHRAAAVIAVQRPRQAVDAAPGAWVCLRRRCASALRGRQLWGVLALLIAAATALMFWQIRAVTAAQVIASLLAALIASCGSHQRTPRWQFLVLLPVLFLCSAVLWPALEYGYRFAAAMVPSARAPVSCRSNAPIAQPCRPWPKTLRRWC
jgi:hypothetical protein